MQAAIRDAMVEAARNDFPIWNRANAKILASPTNPIEEVEAYLKPVMTKWAPEGLGLYTIASRRDRTEGVISIWPPPRALETLEYITKYPETLQYHVFASFRESMPGIYMLRMCLQNVVWMANTKWDVSPQDYYWDITYKLSKGTIGCFSPGDHITIHVVISDIWHQTGFLPWSISSNRIRGRPSMLSADHVKKFDIEGNAYIMADPPASLIDFTLVFSAILLD